MWDAVRNVVRHAGIPLDEALRMASAYPAEVAGEAQRLGRIAPGHKARFVVFEENAMQLLRVI